MTEPHWPGTPLVSPDWLDKQIGTADLVIIDASWYLPAQNRDPWSEFLEAHIPGAVFFDVDAIADPATGLPHMLPRPETFAATMGQMGVDHRARMVIYDSAGLFSAPRVWWTFRTFGVEQVAVLDGGLPRWKSEGRPLESGEPFRPPALFEPRFAPGAVADVSAMERALADRSPQIVDARSAPRFRGDVPEPRAGLRSGHMPGSFNVPFDLLVDGGRLAPAGRIRHVFAEAGVDLARPIITTCGSGVTAAVLSFALASLGKTDVALYDGSWTEWGGREDLPAVTGEGA